MKIRKNVRSLTADEKARYVNALLELKAAGTYDHFVHAHHHIMVPSVFPNEPHDANYRNPAHRGPGFLPWHREFLMQMEGALQQVDPSVTIPFWDWTQDAAAPTASPIWADDFMGGNGLESDQWRVQSGPFAHSGGKWPVPPIPEEGLPGPGLKRQFGVFLPSLPTDADLKLAMGEVFYDTPNYDKSPFVIGFRNRMEGWVTQRGDPRVTTSGSQLHNRVHLYIGGNMAPMTSPNDPVFFLHHCFIDKAWAAWQALQKTENPDAAPHYAPEREGPTGHNLDDQIRPWQRKIRDVLDITTLGYSYETPEFESATMLTAAPQVIRRNPFWAD